METKIFTIQDDKEDEKKIAEAAELIRSGGLVAMPTETVYGLAANGLDEEACRKIFAAKKRPPDNPLILHITEVEQIKDLIVDYTEKDLRLMEELWPGPMTLIYRKSERIPDAVTAGGDTVAVRIPSHRIARQFIEACGVPLAAPSANVSGRPSPTNARDVLQDMEGRIEGIIDGGDSSIGIESTVVDMTGKVPVILRPGFYTPEFLTHYMGEVRLDDAILDQDVAPRSPGQKYKHYAPKAELRVYVGERKALCTKLQEKVRQLQAQGMKVGVMTFSENMDFIEGDRKIAMGSFEDITQMGSRLFSAFRQMDAWGMDIILMEGVEDSGYGVSLMNRIKKASGGKIERIKG